MQQHELHWFVINHISPAVCSTRTARAEIDRFVQSTGKDLTLFAPTFVEMALRRGCWERKQKPLLFHYVFVRGEEADVKALAAAANGFSLIADPAADTRRYLTVSEEDMRSFSLIARRYGNEIPCFAPGEVDLAEGDLVEVATGPFAGIKGTYISRKGASSGAVCISLASGLASMALDVSADYLRILRYASGSRRVYDHIDSYVPRLERAEAAAKRGQTLTADLLAPLHVFLRRMDSVEIPAPRLRAKLNTLLSRTESLLANAPAL